MSNRFMKLFVLVVLTLFVFSGPLVTAGNSSSTVANSKGLKGEFPYQFELAEYEKKSGQKLSFKENPSIKELNAKIKNNPALPSVATSFFTRSLTSLKDTVTHVL